MLLVSTPELVPGSSIIFRDQFCGFPHPIEKPNMIAAIFSITVISSTALAADLSLGQLQLNKVHGESAIYRGKKAVRLIPVPITGNDNALGIIKGSEFLNGT